MVASELNFGDLTDEAVFFENLRKFAESHSVAEIWEALSQTSSHLPEVILACGDIAMCAGDREAALQRYDLWLSSYEKSGSFLPFSKSRHYSGQAIATKISNFVDLVGDSNSINRLIGAGALLALHRWDDLAALGDTPDRLSELEWRESAAIGIAKATNHDYINASAFFVPALSQGYESGNPHSGRYSTILQASEECARLARQYTAAWKTAEQAAITKGYKPNKAVTPMTGAKVDLFIKTCAKDEQFLKYCLASIDKFVSGFRRVVLVTDDDHDLVPNLNYEHIVHRISVPNRPPMYDMPPGYFMQMVVKLCWPEYTDADAVVITDSDTVFTGPFTPAGMLIDGHPVWYHGSWYGANTWRSGTELVIGTNMPHCCMREHPFIFTRAATLGFHEFVQARFGCSVYDLFFSGVLIGKTCEFESLGGYITHISDHGYLRLPHKGLGIVKQYWSWGGVTSEVENSINETMQSTNRAQRHDALTPNGVIKSNSGPQLSWSDFSSASTGENEARAPVLPDDLTALLVKDAAFGALLTELNEAVSSTGHEIEGNIYYRSSLSFVDRPVDIEYAMYRRGYAHAIHNRRRMLEIGVNAGHSALTFLYCNPGAKYVGVDLSHTPYNRLAVAFLQEKFPGQVEFYPGDSTKVMPDISATLGLFDVVHIDGGHTFEVAFSDIWNSFNNLSMKGIMIVDDQIDENVRRAIDVSLMTRLLSPHSLNARFSDHSQAYLQKTLI